MRTRFDYWISGGRNPRWFHGWPDVTKYKQCFTFKWKENRQHQRLYGFLHHRSRRQILDFKYASFFIMTRRIEDETDFSILDRLNEMRKDWPVIETTSKVFLEERGNTQWIQ